VKQTNTDNPLNSFTPEQIQKLLKMLENTNKGTHSHNINQVQKNTPGEK